MHWKVCKPSYPRAAVCPLFRACVSQLQQLFPEMKYVLLGDSGQGDAAFAHLVLTQYKDKVRVHVCVPACVRACARAGARVWTPWWARSRPA